MDKLPRQSRKEWVLTQEALNKLLLQLDSNLDHAAQEYENIRRKLVKFFEYRDCAFPEEYADETINRVIRRIDSGEVIRTDNYSRYFLGVAQNVLREHWRKSDRTSEAIDELPLSRLPVLDPKEAEQQETEKQDEERKLECLQHCLQQLTQENRDLITEYYSDEGRVGIDKRRVLAERLGIPLNNLRIRVHRLREKLEQCVYKCLSQML